MPVRAPARAGKSEAPARNDGDKMKKAGVRNPRHCPRRQLQEMLYGTPTSTSRIVREFRGEYPAVLRLQALALTEYLYTDFGSLQFTTLGAPNGVPSLDFTHSARFTIQTAKAGLNFRL